MSVALVLGTRPEAIKLAPIADRLGSDALIIHTSQHYTSGMNSLLALDLVLETGLPPGASRGEQLGAFTAALDRAFRAHRPEVVIVQGDTTSALAGALAANTTGIPLVHVEAGLRSHDRTMPEEHHRILIDHLADLCCAPTPLAHDNLLAEQIPEHRVTLTGNTIVEAATAFLPSTSDQAVVLEQLGLRNTRFVLATFHRPENTDETTALKRILTELANLPVPVLLPLHPRTQHHITALGLDRIAAALRLPGPLDYPTLLTLIRHAGLVISDSGGIQEEVTIFKRPVLIVRRSNERPETESHFGRRVLPGPAISTTAADWLSDLDRLHGVLAHTPSPFGDGTASEVIVRSVWRVAQATAPAPA